MRGQNLFRGFAKTALAAAEGVDGLVQGGLIEIGPQPVAEEELGVCRLPEQKVADPHFSPGADHEVGVGHVGQSHRIVQTGLGDGLATGSQRCSRLGDVPTASVIEADIQADFEEALRGIKMLPLKARFGVYVAFKYYYSLFKKIPEGSNFITIDREYEFSDLEIEYACGYGKNLPQAVKIGMLKHIAAMYELDGDSSGIMQDIRNLYIPYRKFTI